MKRNSLIAQKVVRNYLVIRFRYFIKSLNNNFHIPGLLQMRSI